MPLWHREINSSKPEMPHRWSWAARQDNRLWRQPQPVPKVLTQNLSNACDDPENFTGRRPETKTKVAGN